jgi:hypothetical protein
MQVTPNDNHICQIFQSYVHHKNTITLDAIPKVVKWYKADFNFEPSRAFTCVIGFHLSHFGFFYPSHSMRSQGNGSLDESDD